MMLTTGARSTQNLREDIAYDVEQLGFALLCIGEQRSIILAHSSSNSPVELRAGHTRIIKVMVK
jgi:hypothetical protein